MIDRGSKIGRFVVVTELGRGGMGAVYAAHDPQLDRQVALKVMHNASGEEEDRVRMLREGQAMARVTHPNVITVYEVGTEGATVFLAQELLDAGTLRGWLEKPHRQHAIIEKFIAAGRGLAAAHAAGLVHRDFKPENVLLGKDGRVRVADFGLASNATLISEGLATTRRNDGPHRTTNDDLAASPMSPLTRTGAVMGTPMFMAPEQHRGERADARSDQFAFCVSLYHALYNAWPFEGKTAPALADAVIDGRLAPPPKNANVSPRLRKILLRGLATDPAQRYPAMDALLADLEQDAQPKATSRTPLLIGTSLAVIAAGGAAAFFALREKQQNVTVVAPPTPTVGSDFAALTTEKGLAWLTTAIDRGQLTDAIDKYDMATSGLQAAEPVKAAMTAAAGAYMRVLLGDLKQADEKLRQATQQAGTDPVAMAYVDLAEAALALSRGQLPAARDRSNKCATQLEAPAPALAAICHQLHGEALAALGDEAAARKAYQTGLALATQQERKNMLQLAEAQLDLDEQQPERAATTATAVQAQCSERGALGCEVQARILLARVRLLGVGEAQTAADLLTTVKPGAIETYAVRMSHAIALGEVHGYLNEMGDDNKPGLDRIEDARAIADAAGFVGLDLDARLARLRVLLVQDDPDAKDRHKELVAQARKVKFERIARLADAALAELADQPRGMLPADGGLPVMRQGSSGPP